MRVLIDGYNLLHETGLIGRERTGRWLEAARHRLLEALREGLSRELLNQTVVVFDAKEAPPDLPAQSAWHGIRILFARDHAEADDLMEELIARASHPRRLDVISSDHRIQRAALRRRATVSDSMDWFESLRAGDWKQDVDPSPHANAPAANASSKQTANSKSKSKNIGDGNKTAHPKRSDPPPAPKPPAKPMRPRPKVDPTRPWQELPGSIQNPFGHLTNDAFESDDDA